jgi:hypothetical protein
MVVEVDVRDDRDLRAQVLDRAVGLVALDDEPAGARARVPAELRDLAADQEGRVPPEAVEDEGDHARRRRLPVRAGNDDRVLLGDELGEELRAGQAGHLAGERGRDDGLEPLRRRLRLLRDGHGDPRRANVLEVGRLVPVPARDLGAPGPGDDRIAREAGSSDAHEPEPAVSERGQ